MVKRASGKDGWTKSRHGDSGVNGDHGGEKEREKRKKAV
jgi:hypothetical protein